MKAIRIHAPGGPEALKFEDVPEPTPAAGQALVKLDAAGVNFIDVYFRTGQYKAPLPMTIGLEGAGTVTAVGPGVTEIKVGDKVAWTGVPGSYAQMTAVPADRLVKLPAGVAPKDGAAAMLQGMTAHYLVKSSYPLKPGDTCLVHAAAGGVGLLLCQIARLRGARVLGTVSTEEKAELAREAGVKRLTEGAGLQVIYDSVGKTTFAQGLSCLAPRGMMVLYGQSSGPVGPFDPQALSRNGSLFLTRPTLAHYIATRDELVARAEEVLDWVRQGKLALRIGHEFPLAEAAEAHRQLEARQTMGKVLLVP